MNSGENYAPTSVFSWKYNCAVSNTNSYKWTQKAEYIPSEALRSLSNECIQRTKVKQKVPDPKMEEKYSIAKQ